MAAAPEEATPIGDPQHTRAADHVRRGRGIFYTPAPVVDFIAEHTLRPLFSGRSFQQGCKLRILDPACGDGAFLLGAYRWLCRWHEECRGKPLSPRQRRAMAAEQLAGIDIDAAAVEAARQGIADVSGVAAGELASSIRAGDALLDHDEWLRGRFDAVLANPPYVNIRRLAQGHDAAALAALRGRYRCARGAFDLYTLFLERSVEALRIGGRLGAIVPNKLATLDYARPCRELLLREGSLDAVVDVCGLDIFAGAEVYPYILCWTKRPAAEHHAVRVWRPASLAELTGRERERDRKRDDRRSWTTLQSAQSSARGWSLQGDLQVESRVATVPLAELCAIHSGATGFQASCLAARLVEHGATGGSAPQSAFPFIVSGNIDRYAIRPGNVRFMGRQLAQPLLAKDDPLLTSGKRRLYAAEKIVLAGMCRRLEAALDSEGLALGVQVYALADWKVDPLYLLGLLNSSLLSHLFRLRFPAKRLAGGYFALSKRQLAQLPVVRLDLLVAEQRRKHDQLVRLVKQRLGSTDGPAGDGGAIDARIDQLVLDLYGVAAEELSDLSAAA